MKIVGICGSPRRGNSEYMLNTVMESCSRRGAETETLLLRRLNVKMCRGCLGCEEKGDGRPGVCRINDDMNGIYPRLTEADVWVMATPVYMEMVSGLLKNFMDRTCAIWRRLEGKRFAGLAVAEEGIGQAIRNFKTYGSLCGMQWSGSVTTLAKNPGDAAKDRRLADRLDRLAQRLVDPPLK